MWLFPNTTLFTKAEWAHLAYELLAQSERYGNNKTLFCFVQNRLTANMKSITARSMGEQTVVSYTFLPFSGDNTTEIQKEQDQRQRLYF